tara:strand:+ start:66712 stop:67539 length:828 start_codon:yes stop_codon:yes gene_type:complete
MFYKIKLLILRILGYEKPLRVALLKYLSLKFKRFRPHYETVLYESCKVAKKLGHDDLCVLELGVADGNGILSLIKYKRVIENELNVKIKVYGFDLGSGLPEIKKKEDLPFFWKQGDYKSGGFEKFNNIKDVKIYQGDIKNTILDFANLNASKIACVFFDLDLYSSTESFLSNINNLEKHLMPRTLCYFDDLYVADNCVDNTNGELLAISEFNKQNSNFQLGKPVDHLNDFKFPLAKGQLYTLHNFKNEQYNQYIGIYSPDSLTGSNKKIRSLLDD